MAEFFSYSSSSKFDLAQTGNSCASENSILAMGILSVGGHGNSLSM